MTPLSQQLEDKKKELMKEDKSILVNSLISLGKENTNLNKKLEQAIAEMQKQRQDFAEKLKERIMRNGNLSRRIVENKDGEFEHKHDYVLNEIVCLIIDDELKQQLNQPKTE